MVGILQRTPCSVTRISPTASTRSRNCLLVRADAARQGLLTRRNDLDSVVNLSLTRRELVGLSVPLLSLIGGVTPVALVAGTPPARAASGLVTPSTGAEAAINRALSRAIPKAKAAVALRLVFHDAGTYSALLGDGGLNASIQYELDRPENFGLKRGWRLVEQARGDLRGTSAEGLVTDADLVALAGAFAVRLCGGPDIRLRVGRPVASSPDPPGRMPGENFSAEQLKANFAEKGFSVQEMVALSGAHTLGSKGFGDPTRFDNEYYLALLRRPWNNPKDSMASMIGLPSDHVLPDDPECLPYIQRYAEDQNAFFADFSSAYIKMTTLGMPGWAA
ncbi:hypothetical protein Vafri_11678 [Volvox africanus]|nr:hypothetical protein Vafri_11678 [Volvox africanus]